MFRAGGFRFLFYSNEGDPREPVHVHVERDGVEAKFWTTPEVRLAYNDGFNARTLRELTMMVEANRTGSRRLGVGSSVEAVAARCDEDSLWVELSDGRTQGVPLAWFPRLLRATAEERADCRVSRRGLHWDALDEDVSVAGLLAGRGDGSQRWLGAA